MKIDAFKIVVLSSVIILILVIILQILPDDSISSPSNPAPTFTTFSSPTSLPTPLPTPSPTPTEISLNIKIPVVLDKPIKKGDTTISGTGPPNVPIRIYEVANTADLLGELIIPEDGQFSIIFEYRPLQATERVAVTPGDLSNTPLKQEHFRGIAPFDMPTYGYILAELAVEP